MELFRENGHFTNEALQAVVTDELSELQRLEASEHLGFCDECMHRYLALLSDDVLLQPSQPLAKQVQKRIEKKNTRFVLLRYGTVAAAACLAVFGWSVGTYALSGASAGSGAVHGAVATAPIAIAQPAVSEEDQGFGVQINNFLGGVFGGLLNGDDAAEGITAQVPQNQNAQQAPPDIKPPEPIEPRQSPPRGQQLTRQQREALFDKDKI